MDFFFLLQMLSSRSRAFSCSVVILGELSVGKSALCRNYFRKNLMQTQELREKTLTNEQISIELLEENLEESDRNRKFANLEIYMLINKRS